MPVYNEAPTIKSVLRSLISLRIRKEIIIIDDGSTDGSVDLIRRQSSPSIRVITHRRNLGKGSAIRTGLAAARGRFVVIQDADRETDPRDIPELIRTVLRHPQCVAFGSRFIRTRPHWRTERRRRRGLTGLANLLLTGATNVLFGSSLTDMTCAYKAAPTSLLRSLKLKSRRFELEAEITARLLKRRVPIIEVPVRYHPRSYRQGKKIHPLDGLHILAALVRLRLS